MILVRLIRQGMKIRYLWFGLGAIALQLDGFVEGRSMALFRRDMWLKLKTCLDVRH